MKNLLLLVALFISSVSISEETKPNFQLQSPEFTEEMNDELGLIWEFNKKGDLTKIILLRNTKYGPLRSLAVKFNDSKMWFPLNGNGLPEYSTEVYEFTIPKKDLNKVQLQVSYFDQVKNIFTAINLNVPR